MFGEFERSREYYCAQLGDNERLEIGFEEEGKFAAKFFSTYIVLEMEDVHMSEAWEARLEFRGSMRITDLVWKPVKKDHRPVVEKLNRCAEFNSKLLDIAGSFRSRDCRAQISARQQNAYREDISICRDVCVV